MAKAARRYFFNEATTYVSPRDYISASLTRLDLEFALKSNLVRVGRLGIERSGRKVRCAFFVLFSARRNLLLGYFYDILNLLK